jgi:hypothetical protein
MTGGIVSSAVRDWRSTIARLSDTARDSFTELLPDHLSRLFGLDDNISEEAALATIRVMFNRYFVETSSKLFFSVDNILVQHRPGDDEERKQLMPLDSTDELTEYCSTFRKVRQSESQSLSLSLTLSVEISLEFVM